MHIHSFTPSTKVNGPGNRAMIHFQGCTLNCPGCFNTATHKGDAGKEMSVDDILDLLPSDIDGITISGGEPFLQAKSLLKLVQALRNRNYSIVIFSGFYRDEISNMKYGSFILSLIDVLIDGRFEETQLASTGIRGSSNQTIHILSDRHSLAEFQERNLEVTIDANGILSMTGFPDAEMRKNMQTLGI